MAQLDFRTGLTGWFEADSITDKLDLDTITVLRDLSGTGNDLTTTPSTMPRFRTNVLNGRPALEFGHSGAVHCIAGPAWSAFIASPVGTVFALVKATAVTANVASGASGNLNDAVVAGSNNSAPGIFLRNNAGAISAYGYVVDAAGAQSAIRTDVALNRWSILIWTRGSGATTTLLVDQGYDGGSVSGTNPMSGTAANVRIGQNHNLTTWLIGYIPALLFFNTNMNTLQDDRQHVVNYLANKYLSGGPAGSQDTKIPRGDPIEQERDARSRRLWAFSRPRQGIRAKTHLIHADIPIGTVIALSHRDWPHPQGLGAGDADTRRARLRVDDIELDLDNLTATIAPRDTRSGVLYAESFVGTVRSDYQRSGVMLLSGSGTGIHTYKRISSAWIEDAGDGRVILLKPEQEKTTRYGLLMEDQSTNVALRSSGVNGTTGLTPVNGSGSVAVDTVAPLLFDTSVSPQGIRLTAGNPHVSETRFNHPAFSITGNAYFRIGIDHCDRDGTVLCWRLQRASDSEYWNDTTGAWQVASVDNALPLSASTSTISQHLSKVIQKDAATGNVTLTICLPAGGTAGRRNTWYHTQVETGSYPLISSRIVTTTATVTRIGDNLVLRNVPWPYERGTLAMTVRPLFDAAAAAVSSDYFLGGGFVPGGATSAFEIRYDASAARWNFAFINSVPTTFEAFLAGAVVRQQEYRLVVRWDGSTLSIFVDGVKGTDAAYSGSPASAASLVPYFGAGFVHYGNYVLTRDVWTQDEIAVWGL